MKKLLFIFFFLIQTFIFADASLNGPSGLVTMPTAQSLHYKEFNISYDYFGNIDKSENNLWRYSVNLGTFENLEIGVVGGEVPEEGVFLNVKYFISEGSERLPLTFATGFENLTAKADSAFYIVVSKTLQSDFHIHGGFKTIFGEELDPMAMFGLNYQFNEKIEFLGDLNGEEQTYFVNIGAKYQLSDNFNIRFNIVDLFQIGEEGRFITLGLSTNKFL